MSAPSRKRKHDLSTIKTDTAINTSFSQLSISQQLPNKRNKVQHHSPSNNHSGGKETNNKKNSNTMSTKESYQELPDYLKVPDFAFKQMLSTAMESADKIVQCLNTAERVAFIHQYTYLVHRLLYVQLQQEQWNYYYQVGTTQNIWNRRVSAKWAKENSICSRYGRSSAVVAQRRKKITQQLQKAENAVKQFEEQSLSSWMLECNLAFDLQTISSAVTAFVRKGQYKLRRQFEQNREMFVLDSTDHRLVQAFYGLTPNSKQVCLSENNFLLIEDFFHLCILDSFSQTYLETYTK